MATHSSSLAWKIPWTDEPGGLQSMESQRVTQLSTNITHVVYIPEKPPKYVSCLIVKFSIKDWLRYIWKILIIWIEIFWKYRTLVRMDSEKLYFKKIYKFIYFNWRLISLHYYIGFAIHWHESTTNTHVFPFWTPIPPPSPSHSSGSSQCTSPEHPVSWIEPGLAIYFTW